MIFMTFMIINKKNKLVFRVENFKQLTTKIKWLYSLSS